MRAILFCVAFQLLFWANGLVAETSYHATWTHPNSHYLETSMTLSLMLPVPNAWQTAIAADYNSSANAYKMGRVDFYLQNSALYFLLCDSG